MAKNVKVIIIILVSLTVLSLIGLAVGFYFLQQERLEVIVLTVELENVKEFFKKIKGKVR